MLLLNNSDMIFGNRSHRKADRQQDKIILGSQSGEDRISLGAEYNQSGPAAPGDRNSADSKREPATAKANLTARLPVIIVASLALSVLFFSIAFDASVPKDDQLRNGISGLSNNYYDYLTKNRRIPGDEAKRRVDSVQQCLIAVSLEMASGNNNDAEKELGNLMVLDGDNQSPLYAFCVKYRKQ